MQDVAAIPSLSEASRVLVWNKWFLRVLGIWPQQVRDYLFVFFITSLAVHCVLSVVDMLDFIDDANYVISNLAENILFVLMVFKILSCRLGCKDMAIFIRDIQCDYSEKKYKSENELMAFLDYNELSRKFVRFSMSFVPCTVMIYFFKFLFLSNKAPEDNTTFPYMLPYRGRPIIPVHNMPTYLVGVFHHTMVMVVIICGYAAPDAFVITLSFHICGQFSALACRIKEMFKNDDSYHREISELVVEHYRLIRLSKTIEHCYSTFLLEQILATTLLLCITGFHTLANSESGNNFGIMIFILYIVCIGSTVFFYCYVGECLINESTSMCDAFYSYDWYNIPPMYLRMMRICMCRAEMPLTLTAGKFFILSLDVFTSIVKTSMAYLSVLRTLV